MKGSLGIRFVTGGALVLALAAGITAILIPNSPIISKTAALQPPSSQAQSARSASTDIGDVGAAEPKGRTDNSEKQPSVVPGGVYRWSGGSASKCGSGSSSWNPIASDCWYPVDLLTDQDHLDIWRETAAGRETTTLSILDYPYPVQHLTITDDSKVNLSAEDASRANKESARIGKLWSLHSAPQFSLPLGPPLAELPEGGRFGSRRFMNGQPKNPHSGADYAATTGTPVLAVGNGTVVLAEEHFFAGNSVFIDHGEGLISMSFHLSQIQVQVGDVVRLGQPIGTVGATGRVTGPHLHFGLRWRGKRINPEALFGRSVS